MHRFNRCYSDFKRIFDVVFAVGALIVLAIPLCIVAVAIKISSKGPVIYFSDRVGINNKIFKMAKFRTMVTSAPQVATHLLPNPDDWIPPVGRLIRKFSVDEVPQLWNILIGELSFVGPRPALFNQNDLIELRTKKGIEKCVPGLTGWAQINGRDELPIPIKVQYDEYYLKNRSFMFDIKIILKTVEKVLSKEGVAH
jgi:O-antigen biosynthesis protein WbqP